MHHPKAFLETCLAAASIRRRMWSMPHDICKALLRQVQLLGKGDRPLPLARTSEFGHGYMLRVLRIWVSGRNPSGTISKWLETSARRRRRRSKRQDRRDGACRRVVRGDVANGSRSVRGGIPGCAICASRRPGTYRAKDGQARRQRTRPSLVPALTATAAIETQRTIQRSKGVDDSTGRGSAASLGARSSSGAANSADWLAKRQAKRKRWTRSRLRGRRRLT